jgi:hypothetical protein
MTRAPWQSLPAARAIQERRRQRHPDGVQPNRGRAWSEGAQARHSDQRTYRCPSPLRRRKTSVVSNAATHRLVSMVVIRLVRLQPVTILLQNLARLDRAERSLRPPRPSGANSRATLGPHADAPRSRHPGAAKTRRCAVPGCREPSVCQPLHGCVAYRLARHDSGESRSVWRVGVVGR